MPEIDSDLDTIKAQIAKLKQTISRLIDGYADGLIDKDESTLRIRRRPGEEAEERQEEIERITGSVAGRVMRAE